MARRKKPNDSNNSDGERKDDSLSSFEGLNSNNQPLLNAPSNNFTCGSIDPDFYKIITYINYCLRDMKKLSEKQLYVEETRCDKVFLYYIKNKERGLTGYVGRDIKNNNNLSYLIIDESRFEWARLEGFKDDRQFVFEEIGAFRKCKTIADFITFMAGERGFVLEDNYILAK